MIIGVPKEIKNQEFRFALISSAAYQLIKRGHEVIVERNAALAVDFPKQIKKKPAASRVPSMAKSLLGRIWM